MNMFLFFMLISSLSFLTYIYRYYLFISYCELYDYYINFNKKSITTQKDKCFIFNHNEHSLREITKAQYFYNENNENNDYLTIMEQKDHYIIYPNDMLEVSASPFIICEVTFNNTHYDITKYLKLFYNKNNVILTRPFITYIFYIFFNIKIVNADYYTIKYIDKDTNEKIINSENINIYKYTI